MTGEIPERYTVSEDKLNGTEVDGGMGRLLTAQNLVLQDREYISFLAPGYEWPCNLLNA